MPYSRALLSALTFFGGHVLNRRLDRVVAVFAALVSVGIGAYLVFPTILFNTSDSESLSWVLRIPAMLAVAIALVSATLAWRDAQAPIGPPLTTGSRVAGGIVSVFGLLILGFSALNLFPETAVTPQDTSASQARQRSSETRHVLLYTSTDIGGHVSTRDLQPPPAGPHALRGRIVLDGRGVADASVQLILNDALETDTLFTDDQGEFAVRLPGGRWTVNRVTVTGWDDAPEGRTLLLFSGHEPAKGPGYYSRYDLTREPRLVMSLPAASSTPVPAFELRDAIDVEWPARTSRLMEEPVLPVADAASSAISWKPVPSATEYEIQLSSMEREDRSTSYSPILRRRQADTKLRLADLPQRPAESPEPAEYALAIFAFDAEGKLVTETDQRGELAFALAGDVRLAEEPYQSSPVSSERADYFRNIERLSLVEGLLEYKQLDAARVILSEVNDDAPPGRKAAMQGAIEALTGNCAAALPLFDKADTEGGLGCAPAKYRRLCEK